MKTKFLFPNHFERIGWFILLPSSFLGLLNFFEILEFNFLEINVFAIYSEMFPSSSTTFGVVSNNIANEIFGILFIIGAIFIGFSNEKYEDEFIAKVRTESLVWSIYANYIILIFCMLFFFELGFFYVMIFNMFTVLTFFIIRFKYMIYMSQKNLNDEK
ncbi:hypothetical protein [Carboxylicivirga marina]|uniref:Uncharacterized protein n=1 Tax=Carboxylicivirga marina TaxID=2800988 RepID=A0ABS1HQF3_9BACT|nr:hypothetical protein [Carboxylicivirga marina]MBK3519909.1 hypothetical protein [Carboxylicivirga marina]